MYGENGKQYLIGGEVISVDEKFMIATLMAVIFVLGEISDGPQIDNLVEGVARAIYNEIQEVQHPGTEEPVGGDGETIE